MKLEDIDNIFKQQERRFDKMPSEAVWQQLEGRLQQKTSVQPPKKRLGWLRYAAAIFLVVLIPLGVLLFNQMSINDMASTGKMAAMEKSVEAMEEEATEMDNSADYAPYDDSKSGANDYIPTKEQAIGDASYDMEGGAAEEVAEDEILEYEAEEGISELTSEREEASQKNNLKDKIEESKDTDKRAAERETKDITRANTSTTQSNSYSPTTEAKPALKTVKKSTTRTTTPTTMGGRESSINKAESRNEKQQYTDSQRDRALKEEDKQQEAVSKPTSKPTAKPKKKSIRTSPSSSSVSKPTAKSVPPPPPPLPKPLPKRSKTTTKTTTLPPPPPPPAPKSLKENIQTLKKKTTTKSVPPPANNPDAVKERLRKLKKNTLGNSRPSPEAETRKSASERLRALKENARNKKPRNIQYSRYYLAKQKAFTIPTPSPSTNINKDSKTKNQATDFELLQQLLGNWKNKKEDFEVVEKWNLVNEKTLQGNSTIKQLEETLFLEDLTITSRKDNIFYTIRNHITSEQYLLEKASLNQLVFIQRNKKNIRYPEKIIYNFEKNKLSIHFLGMENGQFDSKIELFK